MDPMSVVRVGSRRDQSLRLFKSSFMEFFSKVHWSVPLILYVPLTSYFLLKGWAAPQTTAASFFVSLLSGLFFWTLLEYFLHRFLFHFKPVGKTAKRFFFIIHGIHHDYPSDALRLVMPPVLSIPLAILFYLALSRLLPFYFFAPFYGGLAVGYLIYDMIHFSSHHLPMKSPIGLFFKRYHLAHHFRDENRGYGVSSPFWDWVFQTFPKNRNN